MENHPRNQAESQDARLCRLADQWWQAGEETFSVDYQEMERLVKAGANVNFKDDKGSAPLTYAAKYNR
jgi:hypothetical protein